MSPFHVGVTGVLFATLFVALVWWARAPLKGDRALGAHFAFGLSIALLLLVAEAGAVPVLEDLALVLAVLGAVFVSTLASRPPRPSRAGERAR
jgi:multisubunit Na+/H+ antiporter MnhF subunit